MGFLLVYGLGAPADAAWLADFYPVRRMREACQAHGIPFRALADAPGRESEALEGESILLRGLISPLRRSSWEAKAGKLVQPLSAWLLARDKAAYPAFFSRIGCPFPATWGPGSPLDGFEALLPLIVKPRFGRRGEDIVLLETPEDLWAWRSAQALDAPGSRLPEDRVAQEWIGGSAGRDLRVFVAEGRALGAMERRSASLESNVARGGKAVKADLDPSLAELSVRLIAEAGLAYGSADFLYGDGRMTLCEINADPGFEAFEEACSLDAASAILGSVLSATAGDGGIRP